MANVEDADVVIDLSGGKLAGKEYRKRIADLLAENKQLREALKFTLAENKQLREALKFTIDALTRDIIFVRKKWSKFKPSVLCSHETVVEVAEQALEGK